MKNIKVKHFTKLVILCCVLGVLVFFNNKADIHSIVKTSEHPQDANLHVKYGVDQDQIANVYRQTVSHGLRNLRWAQISDGGTRKNFNQSGYTLQSLTDDGDVEVTFFVFFIL